MIIINIVPTISKVHSLNYDLSTFNRKQDLLTYYPFHLYILKQIYMIVTYYGKYYTLLFNIEREEKQRKKERKKERRRNEEETFGQKTQDFTSNSQLLTFLPVKKKHKNVFYFNNNALLLINVCKSKIHEQNFRVFEK